LELSNGNPLTGHRAELYVFGLKKKKKRVNEEI
jgi:hypothetical protein